MTCLTPFDFGAIGDGVTDDTVALTALSSAANALCSPATDPLSVRRFPCVYFPPSKGFLSTATVVFDGDVDITQDSPILISALAGSALKGIWCKNNRAGNFLGTRTSKKVLWVERLTQSDWSSENDVGVFIDAHYVGAVTLRRIVGFCVPFNVCMGYGQLHIQEIRDGKVSIITARSTPDNFTNHLRVTGGAFAVSGGVANGMSRYGIKLTGTGASSGINTIALKGQSYELDLAGAQIGNAAGEAIPIIIDGTGQNVSSIDAVDQRSEGNSGVFARVLGPVRNVNIGLLDTELEYTFPSSLLVDDQSTIGGAIAVYRQSGASAPIWKTLFSSGRLVDKVVQLNGSVVTIQKMECATNVGASPAQQGFTYGDSGPTFDSSGFMTNPGPFYGVRITLNGEQSLAISGAKPTTNEPANLVFLCYDAAGTQITSANAVSGESGSAILNTGVYGGAYFLGINPANTAPGFDGIAKFDPAVATVFVAVTSPHSSMTIKSFYGRAEWHSVTAHMDGFFGDAVPVAMTNVTYKRGMVVQKINAGSGAPSGWVWDGSVGKALADVL